MKKQSKILHIPSKFQIKELHQNTYLLNGELVQWTGEMATVNAAIYEEDSKGNSMPRVLGSIPKMQESDALIALEAAEKSYDNGRGEWPLMTIEQRVEKVHAFTKEMIQQREEVVKWMLWEIGKSYDESCMEFDRTIDYINDTIEEIEMLDAQQSIMETHGGITAQIKRSPLGVVLCMAPYNFPLNEAFCLLIPALLTGNTTIFKPARFGVLLFEPLLRLFQKHFPKGVVNFIYGDGETLATPIMKSGKVDVLALIGNSTSANALQGLHPKQNRLRLVLGLEAKNPAIILPDADLELSVKECVLGSLGFNGQRCTALKIVFVHESLVSKFNAEFVKQVNSLKIGMPWEEGVRITPLPEPHKPNYLRELVSDALSNGAEVLNSEGQSDSENLVSPKVLYPVNESMRVFHEEQFGPIVPIVPFKDVQEPLQYISESNYGQQVSLFSSNATTLAPLIDVLVNQVSRVNINSKCQRGPDVFPFVGRKDSAVSTLSVTDALKSFSVRTMVALKESQENKNILKDLKVSKQSNFMN